MTNPIQAAALSKIHDKMQSGFGNPVTHGDIKTVTNRLQSLNAADARAVVADLAKTGKLDKIAAEIVDGTWGSWGGLSKTERLAFLADMAGKLGGSELAALSHAFGTTDRNDGGATYVRELGEAVAAHAAPQAKVDFVVSLKGSLTDHPTQAIYGSGSTSIVGDADAVAAGEVLGSLRGAQAERAFESLSPAQLKAVLVASLRETTSDRSVSWRAASFNAIMTAGASIGDVRTKADLFQAGTVQLKVLDGVSDFNPGIATLGRNEALSTMTAGLTKVLASDPSGMMRDLTYSADSKSGTPMAIYAKQMLGSHGAASGGKARLGTFLAQLQLGNDLKGNAVDRLNIVTTVPGTNQTQRENAGALGYFVGAVYKGAAANSKDAKAQQELVNTMLKSTLTILDKSGVVGKAGGIAASIAKDWTMYAVRAAMNDEGLDAANKLELAAIPINPKTQKTAVGDAVFSAFEDRLTATERTAHP